MSLYQASIVGKDKHISILTAELQQLKVLPTLNHDSNNNHNHNHNTNHGNHNNNNNNNNKHMKISGDGQGRQGLYDDGPLK